MQYAEYLLCLCLRLLTTADAESYIVLPSLIRGASLCVH